MTAEQFGELAADLWAARQRWEAAKKKLAKTGLIIKRRGQYRAAPAVADYTASGKEVLRLTRMLAA